MTAVDVGPEIAAIRLQVVELAAGADAKLRSIEQLVVTVDALRHDQQNLRGALRAILDCLDQLAPLGTTPSMAGENVE